MESSSIRFEQRAMSLIYVQYSTVQYGVHVVCVRTLGLRSQMAPVQNSKAVIDIPGSHLYNRRKSAGKSSAFGAHPQRSPRRPTKYGCTFSSRHLRTKYNFRTATHLINKYVYCTICTDELRTDRFQQDTLTESHAKSTRTARPNCKITI